MKIKSIEAAKSSASLPFVIDFLSTTNGLSLERGAVLTTVRRAARDELLELDE